MTMGRADFLAPRFTGGVEGERHALAAVVYVAIPVGLRLQRYEFSGALLGPRARLRGAHDFTPRCGKRRQ